MKFFAELKKAGAEFGYRTASDIYRYAAKVRRLQKEDEAEKWLPDKIIDTAVIQKLLPKLHGSKKKLDDPLKALGKLCLNHPDKLPEYFEKDLQPEKFLKADIKYPISFEKIVRMYKLALRNGFTSFAEA
jgi:5-methylcytosine-specific restriction protein B